MKTFKQEWIFDAFADHPTFFTKSMFGGLAVFLFERQMLCLVEPTKSGRWAWNGVFDATHEDFETTMDAVAKRIAGNDRRFGILPKTRSKKA